jgi:type IV secretion system protein VirD4
MRATLYFVGAAFAALALFLVWEAAYCVAVAWYSHSWALWTHFAKGQELLLPIQSALHEWGNPAVKKLMARATLGAVLCTLLVSALVAQIVQNLRGVVPPKGGARLATARDLRKANLFDGQPGYSIFLGRFGDKDVRYSGPSHIYVNGPTRAGKGVGFVLPNALEWRGSLIGLDIKREMWVEIGAARAALGQSLFLFSPGSPESHCWNPLDLVAPWPERATDLTNIARSLIPTPETGDAYWAETARGLFAGLMGYVLDSAATSKSRTIKAALKLMSQGRSLAAVMADAIVNEPELNAFVVDKFRQHIGREEKQRMSFEAHIVTALDAWNNQLVDDATSRSDFNIADLRRKSFTILIGTPVGNFGSVETVVRLLIQQVHDVLLRSLPGLDEPYKLLLMLDEFYQFGRMPEIVDRAPLVAGYGFQIAVIAQGLTQLDVRYGKPTRDMLIGNMDVKLLIGVGDETTAKYCSEEIGKQFVRRESWGASVGGGGLAGGFPRASRTTQGRWELEAIMPSETLRRLDSKKSVLLARGQYAVVLDKINFFIDGRYKTKVKAAARFAARLNVPPMAETFTPAPENALVMPSVDLRATRHKAAFERAMAAAAEVFDDLTPFHSAFVAAMNERGSAAVAELCQRLRTEPETIAELKRRRSLGRRQHHEVLTQNLRAEIIAARNSLNADLAERSTAESATTRATKATDANGALADGDATGPMPLQTPTDSGGAGGSMEAQDDVAKLIDAISEDTGSWTSEVKARIEATLREGSARAAFEETIQSLRISTEMFVDTPDDLPAILESV